MAAGNIQALPIAATGSAQVIACGVGLRHAFCVHHSGQARRQGAGIDPRVVPGGTGGGRLSGFEIDGLIGRYPPYSEARDLIATALLGASEHLKVDPEGRIALPERFKAHAGITNAVVFVGLGDRFRLFSPDGFAAQEAEAKAKLRALKASLTGGTGAGTS